MPRRPRRQSKLRSRNHVFGRNSLYIQQRQVSTVLRLRLNANDAPGGPSLRGEHPDELDKKLVGAVEDEVWATMAAFDRKDRKLRVSVLSVRGALATPLGFRSPHRGSEAHPGCARSVLRHSQSTDGGPYASSRHISRHRPAMSTGFCDENSVTGMAYRQVRFPGSPQSSTVATGIRSIVWPSATANDALTTATSSKRGWGGTECQRAGI